MTLLRKTRKNADRSGERLPMWLNEPYYYFARNLQVLGIDAKARVDDKFWSCIFIEYATQAKAMDT